MTAPPVKIARVRIALMRLPHAADLPVPSYATAGAAGLDLLAAIDKPVDLAPRQFKLIPTGIAIALPHGYEAQVRPRSGLALKHGLTILNAPGTVDADYRGEIGALLVNHGEAVIRLERGMRIAQLVIAAVAQAHFIECASLPPTVRAEGGFGSTGT
jgi:dUTP pyrophosphatase